MTSYWPPKKNAAFVMYVSLISQANTKVMQSTPTIASGDFKVSIDGGALANLTTLPSVAPASSKMVLISLSTSEMNGDNITIVCSDAAGSEWCDLVINLQTTARQIDDLAYPATSGRSIVVDAAGLVDANTVKVGPTGSGTAQTARDVGASVIAASVASGGITAASFAANALDAAWSTATRVLTAATNLTTALATPTNITAGTITNLTNAPSAGDFTATMKTSLNAATPAVTVSDKTGFSLSAAGIQAIWDALTSALTTVGSVGKLLVDNINATISSRLASASYTAPLDAAGVRSAVGLASANLDTQLSGINSKTTNLPAAPAATGDIPTAAAIADQVWDELLSGHAISGSAGAGLSTAGGASAPTANQNADALLDRADAIEAGLTPRQALRLTAAALAGEVSGAATTLITIRNAVADTKTRITASVDADGNRTAVNTDVT